MMMFDFVFSTFIRLTRSQGHRHRLQVVLVVASTVCQLLLESHSPFGRRRTNTSTKAFANIILFRFHFPSITLFQIGRQFSPVVVLSLPINGSKLALDISWTTPLSHPMIISSGGNGSWSSRGDRENNNTRSWQECE